MTRRVITYGLETDGAHYRGIDVAGAGFDWRCTVVRDVRQPGAGEAAGPETLGQIVLRVPGRHNLQNALAAVAVGLDLGAAVRRHRRRARRVPGRRAPVPGSRRGAAACGSSRTTATTRRRSRP